MAQTTLTLPYSIANGSANDASQVMANFNQIASVTNANFIDALSFSQSNAYAAGTSGKKLQSVISVADSPYVTDGTGVADSLAGFNSAQAGATSTGQVTVPAGIWNLSGNTNSTTWILDAKATFTGAGRLIGKVVKHGSYTGTWIDAVSSGVYAYLPGNGVVNAQQSLGGPVVFGGVRSSPGAGIATEAYIGVGAFGYNDKVAGSAGLWGLYATMQRVAGVLGPTHGMEVDIANLGTLAAINPYAMVVAGQSECLWLATGGEATINTLVGTASCAIGILRNDSNATPSAKFDKGIVFDANALAGCNGVTGTGVAVALARGHIFQWYGTGSVGIGYISNQVTTAALATSLSFDDTGFNVYSTTAPLMNVPSVASAVNYPTLKASATTGPVKYSVTGTDANIDVFMEAKGTGVWGVTYGSSLATTPTAFSATRRLPFKDGNNTLWYIPVSTVAW